jgi:3-dehydroquinate synthase class II
MSKDITLQECKDQVAKEDGKYSWDLVLATNDIQTITRVMNVAAELYASLKLKAKEEEIERLNAAFKNGCDVYSDDVKDLSKQISDLEALNKEYLEALKELLRQLKNYGFPGNSIKDLESLIQKSEGKLIE